MTPTDDKPSVSGKTSLGKLLQTLDELVLSRIIHYRKLDRLIWLLIQQYDQKKKDFDIEWWLKRLRGAVQEKCLEHLTSIVIEHLHGMNCDEL